MQRMHAFAPSCWRRSAACCARFRLRLVNSTRAPHCDSALVVAYLRSMHSAGVGALRKDSSAALHH